MKEINTFMKSQKYLYLQKVLRLKQVLKGTKVMPCFLTMVNICMR